MPMPKSNTIVLAEGDATRTLSGVDAARVAADAMLRAALECCHQHDRYARLVARPALEAEHVAAEETCAVVSNALAKMVEAYAQAARDLRPPAGDEDWWHRANALWHASREFVRRGTRVERSPGGAGRHDQGALGDLLVQYDLEASALLALRQAAEAYRKVRPEAW
jgi:hypothetical protein